MNQPPILLECRDLVRPGVPGGSALLRGINLQLCAGDRRGLIGKSGSGKSLLLRGLSRLDPRTTGSVEFRGQSAEAMGIPQFRKHVLYLTQHSTLLPGTVEDNLRLPFTLAARKDESFDRASLVKKLIDLARDEAFLNKPVSELSGGEARIVTVLRALQLEADVLLLDEPTSALDEESSRAVERLVCSWFEAQREAAYLWVTHSVEQVERVAERVWQMQEGQITERA